MVCVVQYVLTTVCHVYSLCFKLVPVSFRIRKFDYGFTSHYLLLIMLYTMICQTLQN